MGSQKAPFPSTKNKLEKPYSISTIQNPIFKSSSTWLPDFIILVYDHTGIAAANIMLCSLTCLDFSHVAVCFSQYRVELCAPVHAVGYKMRLIIYWLPICKLGWSLGLLFWMQERSPSCWEEFSVTPANAAGKYLFFFNNLHWIPSQQKGHHQPQKDKDSKI